MRKHFFGNVLVASALVGAPLWVGFVANGQDQTNSRLAAERVSYCVKQEPRAQVVDKLLQFCLKAEDIPGDVVNENFPLGSSTYTVNVYQKEQAADANDIDWFSQVLPGTALTGLVLGGVLSYGRKPLNIFSRYHFTPCATLCANLAHLA